MTLRILSRSAQATHNIGEAIGRVAEGPLALLLAGDYGTGKTTLVQGLARGLGIHGAIRSPSYNILKSYQGRLVLVHVDLYRTHHLVEVEELGISEVLAANGILAVEWPGDYLLPALRIPWITLEFSYLAAAQPLAIDDALRILDVQWQDTCPEPVKAVLLALTA